MLEVDVDIGRFVAFLGQEALEQQVDAIGVNGRDPEAVANGGVGGGTAPLAQDRARPREPNDVVDRQKVGCVVELLDQPELVLHAGLDAVGHAAVVAVFGALPGRVHEGLHGGAAVFAHLGGVVVAELAESEARSFLGDRGGARQEFAVTVKELRHARRLLEVPLGVREKRVPGRVDRAAVANRRDDVLERASAADVVVRVVQRYERHVRSLGEALEAVEIAAVIRRPQERRAEGKPLGSKSGAQATDGGFESRVELRFPGNARRANGGEQAFLMLQQILDGEEAAAFLGAPFPDREHPRESAIRGAVRRVHDDMGGVLLLGKDDAGAHCEADAALFGGHMGADDTREGVAIRDGGKAVSESGGGADKLLRVARPTQEAEVRRHPELGVRNVRHLRFGVGGRPRFGRVLNDLG